VEITLVQLIFSKVSLSNLWKKDLLGFLRSNTTLTGTNLLELLI